MEWLLLLVKLLRGMLVRFFAMQEQVRGLGY